MNKLKEDYGAEFEYLSYEANADDIDEKVLQEADSLLSRVLYDVVDPIVKYEDTRYIVMSNEGEDKFLEVSISTRFIMLPNFSTFPNNPKNLD